MRGWSTRNPERVALLNKQYKTKNGGRDFKNSQLKAMYGITLDQYEQMLSDQHGVCAICRQAETAKHHNGVVKKLSVDHCHDTGAVRGLLCHSCNTGIGSFGHDGLLLKSATEYLER